MNCKGKFMVAFNPDGSIKWPEKFVKNKEEDKEKLTNRRYIKVSREVVNFSAPKKCILHITVSKLFKDTRFVETTYAYFKEKASVPNKITKINEYEFDVEIGTDFKRCTDCMSLINKYRDFLDGCIIEEKGSCTFEGRKTNFSYADYFD